MRLLVLIFVFATALGQTPAPTTCGQSFWLNVTIRDFSAWSGEGKPRHPDFEIPNAFAFNKAGGAWDGNFDNKGTKFMVKDTLTPRGQMVYNDSTACPSGGMPWGVAKARCAPSQYSDMVVSNDTFAEWYQDGPNVIRTIIFPIEMTLVAGTSPPIYRYQKSKADGGFFPLDAFTPSNQLLIDTNGVASHNYGFTTEVRARLTYVPGASLKFSGDDDVWIFIDDKLVADLGGTHTSEIADVNLDQLNLIPGKEYSLAMFHAERHRDESNFVFESLCLESFFLVNTDPPTGVPTSMPTPEPTRDPTPRPSIAPTFGDPHLVTLDGLRYTFNGVGDYYLVRGHDLDVQMRTHVVSNTSAAVTGVAMRYGSTSVAATWSGEDSNEIVLTINGKLIGSDKPAFKDPAVLAELGSDAYYLTLRGPEMTLKMFYGQRSSFELEMPPVFAGRVKGLLGNFNGDPRDDLVSSGGARVPITSSNRKIHYAFGRTWEVPAHSSLFRTFNRVHLKPYAEQFASTFEPIFETRFDSPAFEARARLVCGDDAQCLYDAAATKDLKYAALTRADNQRGMALRHSVIDAGSTAQGAMKVDL